MSEVSINLQDFIRSDIDKYNKGLPALTQKSVSVLTWLYDKVINSDEEFKLYKLKYENKTGKMGKANYYDIVGIDKLSKNIFIDMASMSRSIPKDVISFIVSENFSHLRIYTFNINSRTITLSIMFSDAEYDTVSNSVFEGILKKIYMWLSIAVQFASDKCSMRLSVYLIMTDLVKTAPVNKSMELSDVNVNSALTMSCQPKNEIYIYRKEEWFKVFIHETMHALGIDFSASNLQNMTELNRYVKRVFHLRVKNDLRLYESYCEFWAETINVLFYVFFSNTTGAYHDKNDNINKINEHLFMERKWALFQCAKITNFYNIKYTDIFSDVPKIIKMVNSNYNEKNTYTFSYYIAKAILFYNMGGFLDWCVDSNNDVINFTNTRENILSFADFVSLNSKSPEMIEQIEHYEKLMNRDTYSQRTPLSTKTALQTMRMSLHEIRE